MKTILKYNVLNIFPVFEIVLWESEGKLHYSIDNYSLFLNNKPRVKDAISIITPEEIYWEIEILGENCEIKFHEYTMDPSIYKLQLIGMDGKEINYHWSSDDTISDKIKDFLDFVEKEVIKDGPSNYYD